jgi:hypothetical protein
MLERTETTNPTDDAARPTKERVPGPCIYPMSNAVVVDADVHIACFPTISRRHVGRERWWEHG